MVKVTTLHQGFASRLNMIHSIRHAWIAAFVAVTPWPVQAQTPDFDWSRMAGLWAESTDHNYGCRPDNLHFRVDVAADKKRITFKLDRLWPIAGQRVTEYSAQVVAVSSHRLVIQYGPELKDIPDEFREWEMVFIGPGTYRWRATKWPAGVYNEVIGVKCLP